MATFDLRYAFRALKRSPFFAIVTIATLALGIAATTSIFAVVNGLLLRPLPYPEPERIVSLQTSFVTEGRQHPRVTGGDWEDLRHSNAFDAVATYFGGEIGVQFGNSASFHRVNFVSPAFFQVFGVSPAVGRSFQEEDAGRNAVISAEFASQHFGSPAAALSRSFSVEATSYEIVGVMPAGFAFPEKAEVWLAAPTQAQRTSRTAYNYRAVARLATSIESANSQLQSLAQRLAVEHPDSNKDKGFVAVSLKDQLVRDSRETLLLLFAAVAVVMLIACINVASLFLARAMDRAKEMSIRGALGAGRWQVLRQLLAECLVVAAISCVTGLGLATLLLDMLAAWAPPGLPRMQEVQLDANVALFAAALSTFAVLAFGLAPAWHASRSDLRRGLLLSGGRSALGGRAGWTRNALVVAEVALSVVLLLGAGLLFRTMLALHNTDLGIRTEGILVMVAHEPAGAEAEYQRVAREISALPEDLRSLPGVQSAAVVMGLPTGKYGSNGSYRIDGISPQELNASKAQALWALPSPGYFQTMGIRLLDGRDFSAADQVDQPQVAIISESLARKHFGSESPLGRIIRCGLDSDFTPMRIIGVVSDVRQSSPASSPEPHLYMALAQHPYYANEVQVVLRTDREPAALVSSVRAFMQKRNPATSLSFTTMPEMVSESIALPRFRWFLGTAFSLVSLLLVAAGIYGLMAYIARQRNGEMGLRMALGARGADVWRLFLTSAAKLGAAGLAIGLALSFFAGRVLEKSLYGVTALDFMTYAASIVVIALVILAAVAIPARRAASVDPLAALREE